MSAKRDWASAPPAEATAEIDARLAALPANQRAVLQALRETIAAAAPEAVETISYDLPAFRYHGRALVAYLGAKRHCSLFPMGPEIIEAEQDELAAFDTNKGIIRFTVDHPLPPHLVTRIVQARIAQIDARRQ